MTKSKITIHAADHAFLNPVTKEVEIIGRRRKSGRATMFSMPLDVLNEINRKINHQTLNRLKTAETDRLLFESAFNDAVLLPELPCDDAAPSTR